MTLKNIHYLSGLLLAVFIGIHLLNHLSALINIETHIHLMQTFRLFYRNIFVETALLLAVGFQIISGWVLFRRTRKEANSFFEKLHIWSGLYLAFFFTLHVSAVMVGRLLLHLDTNFYFGAAGINTFPFCLFFVPYYATAILSFFAHIASVHHKRMTKSVLGVSPQKQSVMLLILGVFVTVLILYGMSNRLRGIVLPEEYKMMVGK